MLDGIAFDQCHDKNNTYRITVHLIIMSFTLGNLDFPIRHNRLKRPRILHFVRAKKSANYYYQVCLLRLRREMRMNVLCHYPFSS